MAFERGRRGVWAGYCARRHGREVEALDPLPPSAWFPTIWRPQATCRRDQRESADSAVARSPGGWRNYSARLQGSAAEGGLHGDAVWDDARAGAHGALFLENLKSV